MTCGTEWQGRVGQTWADEWQRTERAMSGIGAVLDSAIANAAPPRGRALDIGCGVGSTALALAHAAPHLQIIGVDLSVPLVRVARARAGHVTRLAFEAGDALATARDYAPFDLLVSRHGVMFFDDSSRAFAQLRGACRDGATLVFSCFRARTENAWATVLDAAAGVRSAATVGPGPFSLADHAGTTDLLRRAGWSSVNATPYDVAYVLGDGPDPIGEAVAFARRIGPAARVIADAGPPARGAIEDRLRTAFASRVEAGRVSLPASVWIWTARAGGPP